MIKQEFDSQKSTLKFPTMPFFNLLRAAEQLRLDLQQEKKRKIKKIVEFFQFDSLLYKEDLNSWRKQSRQLQD